MHFYELPQWPRFYTNDVLYITPDFLGGAKAKFLPPSEGVLLLIEVERYLVPVNFHSVKKRAVGGGFANSLWSASSAC